MSSKILCWELEVEDESEMVTISGVLWDGLFLGLLCWLARLVRAWMKYYYIYFYLPNLLS